MKLLKSTLAFSAMTTLSRVAGYVRDMVQAQVFGASVATDAFLIAYRIPNFLRRIFAEGSFSQAFVPVFSELKQKGDEAALRDLLDHVAGALCAAVLIVTALGILAAPLVTLLFAPGSLEEPGKFDLTTQLLRITFPYLTFISMTALAAGVLNSYGKFALPAATPILHNLSVIAAALWLAPMLGMSIHALAWGVLAAGIVQMGVQWIALAKLGVLPRFRFRRDHPEVNRVLRLMLPTLFGSSVAQINLLVGTVFASLLATGSQTWLYLTDRLLEFPLGIFGAALGTVVLPHLSRRHAATDPAGYSAALDWALRMALLVAIPATLGLVTLAVPINATLYQHGKFSAEDTRMAALALMALGCGLPGFMLSKVLAPAFYARQDTKTPVKSAVVTVVVNILLNIAITGTLWKLAVHGAHAGIALSTAISGLVNAAQLAWYLRRQGHYTPAAGWRKYGLQLGFAGAAMVGVLLLLGRHAGDFTVMATGPRVLWLALLIGSGALTFGVALLASGLRPRDVLERQEP